MAASAARAHLETVLRARKLDRTLTTSLPVSPHDAWSHAPTGLPLVDAQLDGGFPRGQLSEVVGPRSSGRTSLLLAALAAATMRDEVVALIDALDVFDAESAKTAGILLDRLLWVRGQRLADSSIIRPSLTREYGGFQQAIDRALKATGLVLEAGNFGVVALDLADMPEIVVRRIPFTTWMRLHRLIEGSQTVCVLLGTDSMARSSAGLTLALSNTSVWARPRSAPAGRPLGIGPGSPFGHSHPTTTGLFADLRIDLRVIRARGGKESSAPCRLTARA